MLTQTTSSEDMGCLKRPAHSPLLTTSHTTTDVRHGTLTHELQPLRELLRDLDLLTDAAIDALTSQGIAETECERRLGIHYF
jgi:hypothetical protein